jgi:vacuolar-type H+-ATPase subunit H
MEKVWGELKKIEAQAEQIRTDAQQKAKQITTLAQQEAEKLMANSKTYAEAESQKLNDAAIQQAKQDKEKQLKNNEAVLEKLRTNAQKRMDQAVLVVVDSVLEEN